MSIYPLDYQKYDADFTASSIAPGHFTRYRISRTQMRHLNTKAVCALRSQYAPSSWAPCSNDCQIPRRPFTNTSWKGVRSLLSRTTRAGLLPNLFRTGIPVPRSAGGREGPRYRVWLLSSWNLQLRYPQRGYEPNLV